MGIALRGADSRVEGSHDNRILTAPLPHPADHLADVLAEVPPVGPVKHGLEVMRLEPVRDVAGDAPCS